jgi:hypothetical protein
MVENYCSISFVLIIIRWSFSLALTKNGSPSTSSSDSVGFAKLQIFICVMFLGSLTILEEPLLRIA